MSAVLAVLGWLALLPILIGSNWLRARYGGGDYPLWYLLGAWLLAGLLIGIAILRAARDERRPR